MGGFLISLLGPHLPSPDDAASGTKVLTSWKTTDVFWKHPHVIQRWIWISVLTVSEERAKNYFYLRQAEHRSLWLTWKEDVFTLKCVDFLPEIPAGGLTWLKSDMGWQVITIMDTECHHSHISLITTTHLIETCIEWQWNLFILYLQNIQHNNILIMTATNTGYVYAVVMFPLLAYALLFRGGGERLTECTAGKCSKWQSNWERRRAWARTPQCPSVNGTGTTSQNSTELTTLLQAVCTHPLPKLIWPPSEPSNTPPLLYLQEEGRMQEGSVLG